MSARLRFSDVKTACARVLDLVPTDTRVLEYVNRAQEMLLNEGDWVGTTGRYRVCVKNSCLTWPREIETIYSWAICDRPGTVRGEWYEFVEAGPGIQDDDSCNGTELIDRGDVPSYDDPTGGTTKVYEIYAEASETTTTKFIVQGYDFNGNWGTEELTIPTIGNYTTGTRSIAKGGLTGVIKPATVGRILFYEYDTSALTRKELGQYAADEEVPVYRRSLIPGLTNAAGTGTCTPLSVTIRAALRHIPVAADNDFLLIGHRDALQLECAAIRARENQLDDEYQRDHAEAKRLLDKQLNRWHGKGEIQPFQVANPDVYGGAFVNLQ